MPGTTATASALRCATTRELPSLHLITDTRGGRDPLLEVRATLAAGPCAIQVRSKELSDRAVLQLTLRVIELARPFGALVLVDDRVDVALAAGADGVHVGAEDLPVARVRPMVPTGFVIGATVRTPSQARTAEDAGATYLGAGPAYATTTKVGLPDVFGPEGVAEVVRATRLPVIAIGWITAARVAPLRAAGAHGVAVVAAVSEAHDPAAAAAALTTALQLHPRPLPASAPRDVDPETVPAAR